MASSTDGGGGAGTGSDSGVTSPSPPTTSRQEGDEQLDEQLGEDVGDPVDRQNVSLLPDQLPPPSDASTPLKVDCNRTTPQTSSIQVQRPSQSSDDGDDDVDNELGK